MELRKQLVKIEPQKIYLLSKFIDELYTDARSPLNFSSPQEVAEPVEVSVSILLFSAICNTMV